MKEKPMTYQAEFSGLTKRNMTDAEKINHAIAMLKKYKKLNNEYLSLRALILAGGAKVPDFCDAINITGTQDRKFCAKGTAPDDIVEKMQAWRPELAARLVRVREQDSITESLPAASKEEKKPPAKRKPRLATFYKRLSAILHMKCPSTEKMRYAIDLLGQHGLFTNEYITLRAAALCSGISVSRFQERAGISDKMDRVLKHEEEKITGEDLYRVREAFPEIQTYLQLAMNKTEQELKEEDELWADERNRRLDAKKKAKARTVLYEKENNPEYKPSLTLTASSIITLSTHIHGIKEDIAEFMGHTEEQGLSSEMAVHILEEIIEGYMLE
jgi:hypothetical protein